MRYEREPLDPPREFSLVDDPGPDARSTPPPVRAWEEGEPLKASAPLLYASERLLEAMDLRFGQWVLDVGTGTGNAALAAARRGARAVGLDTEARVLRSAEARARAEGVRARWVAGRAESLPFIDGAFDITVSVFGAMFSADPEEAAAELLRVTCDGGTVGLASWTSEGLLGRIYAAAAPPDAPNDGADPTAWGSREHLSSWFGSSAGQMSTALRTAKLRGPTTAQFVDYLAKTLGPVVQGMAARDADGQAALHTQLVEICEAANKSEDDTFLGPAQYLEVIVHLR
jgi:ubiquinone/menaquinone biosynthesis C-methylase UbiE